MFQSLEMQWAFKIYNNFQVFKSSEIFETFIVLSESLRRNFPDIQDRKVARYLNNAEVTWNFLS